jgi:hypothetical protein
MNLEEKFEALKEINRLVGVSLLELVAVIYDQKPVLGEVINIKKYDQELINRLNKANEICKTFSLKLAVSNCKFIVNSPLGIFEKIKLEDERPGKLAIGISKDMDKALEGVELYYRKMLSSEDSRRFGEVMGYPECCLDFGDYLAGETSEDNFGFRNPAVESLKRSQDFHWQLNVFTFSMLPYYPCSLSCTESIKKVDDNLTAAKELSPSFYSRNKNYACEPASLYWTCADRILLYGDFKGDFYNSEVAYAQVESLIDSINFYQENNRDFIDYLKKVDSKIKQGDKIVMAPEYFEIFKKEKSIAKFKKDNKYEPVLVKPNK